MKSVLIRLGLAALGVAATLTWWTLHPGNSHTQSSDQIPSKVWTGGHTLAVEVESDAAATMRISFSQHDKPIGEQQTLETYEKIPAGARSWTIDVPSQVGGYIEIQAENPNVGDRLSMRIRVDGKLIDEQIEKLDAALQPNTAFFLQDHFDDYSNAASEAKGEDQ